MAAQQGSLVVPSAEDSLNEFALLLCLCGYLGRSSLCAKGVGVGRSRIRFRLRWSVQSPANPKKST